jgi:hypothetical protein
MMSRPARRCDCALRADDAAEKAAAQDRCAGLPDLSPAVDNSTIRDPTVPACEHDLSCSLERHPRRPSQIKIFAPIRIGRASAPHDVQEALHIQGFGCMPCSQRSGLSGPMGISSKLIICF